MDKSAYNIGRNFNFLPVQQNWNSYDTLADAESALLFKQPGLLVYIISEDTWYYWKSTGDGFVLLTTEGSLPS